jgi:ATP-dependent RNA helicase RhlE
MNQGHARLGSVEMFVLDEADRMLDMGFMPDVRRVVATLPARRQNLMFSATMPANIVALASKILVDAVKVSVTPSATPADRITQSVLFVERGNKRELLRDLLQDPEMTRVLVFTRTKHSANRVAEYLEKKGETALAIHGNKSQGARQKALESFKQGRVRVLVATDIAARGIDVDDVTHVINYELPNEAESYIHRIGRTARAGASGIALSFCDGEERTYLRDIERMLRKPLQVVEQHRFSGRDPRPQAPRAKHQEPRRFVTGKPIRRREHQVAATAR